MADPLGLRAEANQHPGNKKTCLSGDLKSRSIQLGEILHIMWFCTLFFLDDEMRLREVEDLHTEVCGNQ